MKVSIVGAGNAGVFTALYYSWYGRKKDLEVELIHDPNIPPEEVGQATLLGAPELISTKFNYYDNYIHATPKTGICLLYTSPSPRDLSTSRMPSSA